MPDPGSFGPDRMDDLEGDVEGWVGKRGGVSGALVAACGAASARGYSDRNRELVNEDGIGEGDRNDLRCRSSGSCSVIVICRAGSSAATCLRGRDSACALANPVEMGSPSVEVLDFCLSSFILKASRADWNDFGIVRLPTPLFEGDDPFAESCLSSSAGSGWTKPKVRASNSFRIRFRSSRVWSFAGPGRSSTSSKGTVTVVRLWSRIPNIWISYILHLAMNRSGRKGLSWVFE